ncbi:hypothetical protein [Streptomyces boninensis]|uniref:hypothetical protein n=1 Tax=Streptomyces boninensis TaxID=2039455 RepID=UPI003B2171C9
MHGNGAPGRPVYRPTVTPEGSTHVDTEFTGTTSWICRTAVRTLTRPVQQSGLDVLVHGEAERNDMVQHGWVQARTLPSPEERRGLRHAGGPVRNGSVRGHRPSCAQYCSISTARSPRSPRRHRRRPR